MSGNEHSHFPSERSPQEGASEKQMMQWMQKSVNTIDSEIKGIHGVIAKLDKEQSLDGQKLEGISKALADIKAQNATDLNKLNGDIKDALKDLKETLKELSNDHKKTHDDLNGLKVSLAKWGGGLATLIVILTLGAAALRLFL